VALTTGLADVDSATRELDLGITSQLDAAAFLGFNCDAWGLVSNVLDQLSHVFVVVFGADLDVGIRHGQLDGCRTVGQTSEGDYALSRAVKRAAKVES
jgi:hypothetical protein